MITDCESVGKVQRNIILYFKIFGVPAPPVTIEYEVG
jgi:hypothetical protein